MLFTATLNPLGMSGYFGKTIQNRLSYRKKVKCETTYKDKSFHSNIDVVKIFRKQ